MGETNPLVLYCSGLVFFTTTEHERASVGDISFLTKACGIPWPSEPRIQYYSSLLAPCRNGSKSIREMFGYSERPSAIQPGGKSVLTIGQALANVLSFALTPLTMTPLCATAKRVNETCGTPEAWIGNAVDTRGIRPNGKRVYNHFAFWRQTRYVISGKWCQGNVALLISVHPWQWDIEGEKHGGLFVSISTSLIVCSARLFFAEASDGFDRGLRFLQRRSHSRCNGEERKQEARDRPWLPLRGRIGQPDRQQ